MHESFLIYRDFRYLKLSIWLVVLSIAAYLWHSPVEPPNGGTWLGYTLGGISAFIILMLLWLGVRKRSFHSSAGKTEGWLSGHVYLGGSLLVVASLHSGFQFDWNIHTLAYVLMVIVILSGFYGVYTYVRFPELMTSNRAGKSREMMVAEIEELDRESLSLADGLGPEVHQLILDSVENTQVGGGLLRQIRPQPNRKLAATIRELTDRMARTTDSGELASQRNLVDYLRRKSSMVERLQRDIYYHGIMQFWLFLHIPLSMGLLAALIAHIVSVFLYW